MVNRPIKNGQYWIGTHDDITERIHAERKSAALTEQERRRVSIETEIRAFRESVAAVLRTVTESSAALNSIAVALSDSSGFTSDRAASAGQTSNEASANMIAAAGATEELIASMGEIGRQISRAAEVASHSVVEAQTTNKHMARLTDTVQQIGEVVNLIRNIAGQTNLLALNATIEAARARAKPGAVLPWLHRKSNRLRFRPRKRLSKSPARLKPCKIRRAWRSTRSGATANGCAKSTAIRRRWRYHCNSRTARPMKFRTTWRAPRRVPRGWSPCSMR